MTKSEFSTRWGFERSEVSLANWREAPWSAWSFRNVSEFVPSARIAAERAETQPAVGDPTGLFQHEIGLSDGTASATGIMAATSTDALVVMRAGTIVAEYNKDPTAMAPHVVFSVSKSITGLLAGVAMDDGCLDPEAPVIRYVPEVQASAFGDATVRHLLDMLVSLDFSEDYLTAEGDYGRYRRAVLWNPVEPGGAAGALLGFLSTLRKGRTPHGETFVYRSPVSDMLAIVVERATGRRYADYASERLWKPLGATEDAFVTVDAVGAPRGAGGVSMTARDLARVGELLRLGGRSPSGTRILSESWVADTVATGGSQRAWRAAGNAWLPDGRYRNQWYQTGYPEKAFAAIGVHGQWLYVDPSTETVIAKLSSQPLPSDDEADRLSLDLLRHLSKAPV
ncbi:beta-lactamase family protein [Shinella sp. CPCC 101442]|uniref:serine hydrolase domain-containing protein n=1 Tax=Shinella sp. CPCC 101442 TaxID=2932265 RepID=UPI0021537913|nr:serine hydrolase [Shinella sp. CPCC 101442]MCR6501308.1 beta-lactamase family protein [Shinella sp. CPCC 101442]